MKLKRTEKPILEPISNHPWESRAVLNPGTVKEGNYVHMLYRAVEGDNYSTIGYAKLDSKGQIIERHNEPVIKRNGQFESKGCEDPRITKFEDKYYVFYTGYDGQHVRICGASTTDFFNYQKYGVVMPDVSNKDAMIFPEKINGKVIFIHRVEPNIQFAYFDDIEQLLHPAATYWQNYLKDLDKYTIMKREFEWESQKIGAGPPPIKTDHGWILIYHGVDDNLIYRAGVALLDLENPSRVIARYPDPILEPEMEYEQKGDVPNVVFPEGTAIFDNMLYVYYGGADKVISLATIEMDELLEELLKYKK